MLPTALAADLCSLLPERDRLCLCAIMILDANGRVTRTTVVEGVIRGAAYLTYGSVAQTLGFTDQFTAQPAALAFKKDLKVLDEVTRKLRRLRMGRGALDLDLPEPKLTLEEETLAPSWVEKRTQDPGVKRAYQLVEECMLAANEAVARWLQKRHSAGVYRVHAKPDEEKLERLANICEVLSVPCDIEALLEPKGLGRFLRKVANHEKAQVLEGLLLRSLKQAAYDVHNIGHFGLAAEAYVHFTSPIRRYPDLMVHRLVKHLLRGNKADESPQFLESLGKLASQASTRERAVMQIEREVVDLYRALLMRDYIGDVFDGRVTAITQGGLYIALDDPFVDVLVPFDALGPDN
jgi:ribonuclease R